MKTFVAAFFLLLLQQQAPPKGSIEGIVVRIGTDEPIADARIVVTRAAIGQIISQGAPLPNLPAGAVITSTGPNLPGLGTAIPAVSTDSQGKFVVKDLDAGSYRVSAAANGFARQEYGQRVFGAQGTPITLAAGQALKDVGIRLTPAGYLNGRISDDLGRPAVGAAVQLVRGSYDPTGRKTFQSAGQTRTNDRGEYRIYWVTPGRYYLYAGSTQGPVRPIEIGGAGDSPNGVQESYAQLYYPGVIDIKDAAVIDVQPGAELNAIDFSLPRQRLYRIRGRVIEARTGQRPAAASMSLGSRSLTGGGFSSGLTSNYNASDGTFELRDVAPGNYTVAAQIQEPGQTAAPPIFPIGTAARPFGATNVTVSGADVEGIIVTITSGASIPGRITVEGQELSAVNGLDRIRVQLSNQTSLNTSMFLPQPQTQTVNATDGSFREDSVFPGEYRVTVVPLPPGFYLKEVRFDQTDSLNKPLQFTGSVSTPLDVVISAKGAQIDGSVTNEKQEPARGIQAVLIPDQHRDRTDLFKTVLTDQNGRFSFRGVPPGDYKIFAWEAIEQFSYYDSDVVQRFESKGKPIHVNESDKANAEVKIIPADGG